MITKEEIKQSFQAAFPIMLGYVAIGLPCGILSDSIGLNPFQVLIMSILFYSGAGQFMISNMWIAGSPIASIIASVSLVNTRQMLYSAAFAPVCSKASKLLSFMFTASVTDESYGMNVMKFEEGNWSVRKATLVNAFSNSSWTASNVLGCVIGNVIGIPLAVAAFAMTSIFICLVLDQKMTRGNVIAMVVAVIGVFLCKLVGLSGPAILVGALAGIVAAIAYSMISGDKGEQLEPNDETADDADNLSSSANDSNTLTNQQFEENSAEKEAE